MNFQEGLIDGMVLIPFSTLFQLHVGATIHAFMELKKFQLNAYVVSKYREWIRRFWSSGYTSISSHALKSPVCRKTLPFFSLKSIKTAPGQLKVK